MSTPAARNNAGRMPGSSVGRRSLGGCLLLAIASALALQFAHMIWPLSTQAAAFTYVYMSDPNGNGHQHPTQFRFSEDGDLIGQHLAWRGWGRSSSTAAGLFAYRVMPGRSVTLRGTVTAYDREPYCETEPKTAFYNRVSFDVPGAPWSVTGLVLGAPRQGTECILQ